jgi:hypothetical protein
MVTVKLTRAEWELVMIALENKVFDKAYPILIIYSQIEDQVYSQEY